MCNEMLWASEVVIDDNQMCWELLALVIHGTQFNLHLIMFQPRSFSKLFHNKEKNNPKSFWNF